MFQAAATFGAGLLAGQGLGACQERLPGCRLRSLTEDAGTAFRLSVHVIGARSDELARPGFIARPELRLEVVLGQARKQTEAADFVGEPQAAAARGASNWGDLGCTSGGGGSHSSTSRSSSSSGASAAADLGGDRCPWRFDDTLTFAVGAADVLGGGLRLRLGARSDVHFGPLQVRLPTTQDLGEGILELRAGVLSACRLAAHAAVDGRSGGRDGAAARGKKVWQTPVLVVPLIRAGDLMRSGGSAAVSHVWLSCSVSVDPEKLLLEAEQAGRSLVDRVVDPCMQCVQAPGCGALHYCTAGLSAAPACSARSPRHLCSGSAAKGAGVGSPESSAGQDTGVYATCEVPSALTSAGSPPRLQEAIDDWSRHPSMNGLAGLSLAYGGEASLGSWAPSRCAASSVVPSNGAVWVPKNFNMYSQEADDGAAARDDRQRLAPDTGRSLRSTTLRGGERRRADMQRP